VAKSTEERDEFKLRPRRPTLGGKNETLAWSTALRTVFRYASTSARRIGAGRSGKLEARPRKQFNQRCAVRITYTKNKVAGQWRAHGRYIARESAAQNGAAGFTASESGVEPSRELDQWQKQGDARLWKFIVSPEFGDRVDLQLLTRELTQKMEKDLGTRLEWVAVSHFNTEHPHVHVALRGVRDDGSVLDLPRDYIKSAIRLITEDLCTRQLGYRTEIDAREAERREATQSRVTSLDRIIERANTTEDQQYFVYRLDVAGPKKEQARNVEARLFFLQKAGLANPAAPGVWNVRSDFVSVLKAMQQVADRQRSLAAHRALVSDERLPLVVTEPREIKQLEGRVLGHGEDENGQNFGKQYMLLEGTDAKIHLIYHTPEMQESRSRGQLAPNSFVRLRKRFENGRPLLEAENLGDSEALLKNKSYFRRKVWRDLSAGVSVNDESFGGWLGRYRDALKVARQAFQQRQNEAER
jgi:type IV secretory pathway VirD2 relaxase